MTLPDVLRTQRLVLRPFRTTDAAAVFQRWDHDSAVSRYMRWPPRAAVEQTEQVVQRAIERRRQGIALSWAITLPDDDDPLGFIGLIPEGHMAELSYILAREAWGRGYATEAARAVIETTLELPGVYRIWAMCDVDNVASARVLEKLGMQLEGTVRRYAVRPALGPEPRDAFLFARVR
jgi:ribosomal-protein-alanine N-acetyltransferase